MSILFFGDFHTNVVKVRLLPVFFDEVAALNERIDCQIICKQ
jgi:hypothetical protein